MDWQAVVLSLQLAAATLALLLPAGLWLGRWLARTDFAGKAWIEAVVITAAPAGRWGTAAWTIQCRA